MAFLVSRSRVCDYKQRKSGRHCCALLAKSLRHLFSAPFTPTPKYSFTVSHRQQREAQRPLNASPVSNSARWKGQPATSQLLVVLLPSTSLVAAFVNRFRSLNSRTSPLLWSAHAFRYRMNDSQEQGYSEIPEVYQLTPLFKVRSSSMEVVQSGV